MTRLIPLIALVLAGAALAWAVLPVDIQTYPKPCDSPGSVTVLLGAARDCTKEAMP